MSDNIKELVKRLRAEEWATVEREKTRNAAAAALEAMAGEVASLKLSNDLFQGAQKKEAEMNTQLTIQLHAIRAERDRLKGDLSVMRLKLEAKLSTEQSEEIARLKAALEFIDRGTTGSPDAIIARKALGGDA